MVTHIYFAVLRKVAISKYVSTAQSTKFPLKKDFFYECEPISRLLTKENLVIARGESRAAATSKMECFVIIVNGYHKVLHLGCCSSPRSASDRSKYL